MHNELIKHIVNSANTVVIHYSCESFNGGRPPRITSIAVYSLQAGRLKVFALSPDLEDGPSLDKETLDRCEHQMLGTFCDYARRNQEFTWMHWNMKSDTYGFEAIENRYRQLGGEPCVIPESNRFNLANFLTVRYGADYIPHPRLESLAIKNGISTMGFLRGAEEPEAFARGDYDSVKRSTMRKVEIIATIARMVEARTLKTDRQPLNPLTLIRRLWNMRPTLKWIGDLFLKRGQSAS